MARVAVTGAAGYLASWVVKLLLEQGHTVHGTVRSLKDGRKLAHLQRLSATHPGRLALFEADLLGAQGFDAAMQGCSAVLHTASPYRLGASADPERELIAPAVVGTRHVLEAVNRTASVQRVVVTSSIAAMFNASLRPSAAPPAAASMMLQAVFSTSIFTVPRVSGVPVSGISSLATTRVAGAAMMLAASRCLA